MPGKKGLLISKKLWWIVLWGYLILGGGLYFNSLDNSFHYDDRHVILKNQTIREISQLPGIWIRSDHSNEDPAMRIHYRPVVYSSYLLNYVAGGTDPVGYHLVNLSLHVGMAFLTALVLARLTGRRLIGVLAGGLFLIHPFNAEAVNYVTARSSQLYAFFFLLAFYAYLRYRHRPEKEFSRWMNAGWLGVCCAAFVLSLLSKEMAVAFPAFLLLYEGIVRRQEGWRERLRRWAVPGGFALIGAVVYIGFRSAAIGEVMAGKALIQGRGEALDGISLWATQGVALVRTLGLTLWPSGLTIDHRVTVYSGFFVWQAAGAMALLLGVLALVIGWTRSENAEVRTRAFLLSWFLIVLAPVAVIPLNSMLQENRAYLAIVGVLGLMSIGIVWCGDHLRTRTPMLQKAAWVGIGCLALVYGGMTFQRNRVWQDEISLLTDAVQKDPYSGNARQGLGLAYLNAGQWEQALEQYRRFWVLEPGNPDAAYSIGAVLESLGQKEEAGRWFREAFRLRPGFYLAMLSRGKQKEEEAQWEEAIRSYRRAIRLWPEGVEAHRRMGILLERTGRPDEASAEFRRIRELKGEGR